MRGMPASDRLVPVMRKNFFCMREAPIRSTFSILLRTSGTPILKRVPTIFFTDGLSRQSVSQLYSSEPARSRDDRDRTSRWLEDGSAERVDQDRGRKRVKIEREWSSDGKTLYYTSARDGHTCLWGQRIETESHRPVGKAFAVQHFHGHSSYQQGGWSLAEGRIVVGLVDNKENVWMMSRASNN